MNQPTNQDQDQPGQPTEPVEPTEQQQPTADQIAMSAAYEAQQARFLECACCGA